jgi:hypothetical protein
MSLTACNGGLGLTTGCRATCLTISAVSLGQLRGVRGAVCIAQGTRCKVTFRAIGWLPLQDPLRLHARLDSSFETALQDFDQVV